MIEKDVITHEVEYSYDAAQENKPQPKVETTPSTRLSTDEFIQKRKAIIDKLIEMSIDPEQA